MASIKGLELKNVKHPIGREGEGLLASIYLNGKKIATYEDYGDGAMEDVTYVKPEYDGMLMEVIIAFAKEHHNEYIENLYMERPLHYENEVAKFKKHYPNIPDEDITIQTMSQKSIVYIISALETLIDKEKIYKKHLKAGYDIMGIKGDRCTSFNSSIVPMDEINAYGFDEIYRSTQDFKLK